MRSRPRQERPEPKPGQVTGTSVQVRDSNRLSVHIDGDFSFGMPLDAAMDLGIHKGVEMDEALLARCLAADASYRARQRALGLLAHRQRSSFELRSRLTQAGFPPEAVDEAIARMDSLGYLDDTAFANAFVRDRLLGKRHGARRVLSDLRAKGIDGKLATETVDRVGSERDESEDAYQLASRRDRSFGSNLDPRKRRQRLYGMLLRRGFSSDAIRVALSRVASERGTEDSDES